MTTYVFNFTTSSNKKIQTLDVKANSKEKAVTKFYKKYRAESTSLLKVYEA